MIKLKTMLAEDNYYGAYNKKRNAAADEYRPSGLAVEPTPTEWNDLIDQLNDDPRFTTHSSGQKQYVKNNETGKSFAIQWDTMDGYWRAPGSETKAEDVVLMARKEYGIGGSESSIDEQIRTDIFFDDNNKFTNAILGMTLAETARIVFQIELYSKQLEQTYRSENISSERFKSNMDPEKQRRISLGIIDKFKKLLTTSINNIDAIKNNL